MPYYIWFAFQKKKEKNKASKINGLEIAKYFWIVSRRELVIYTKSHDYFIIKKCDSLLKKKMRLEQIERFKTALKC